MDELIIFVHRQGSRKMTEIAVTDAMTVAEMMGHAALQRQPVQDAPEEILVFFGESEEPASSDDHVSHCRTGQGGRVHLTRCRRVEVTVYYTHLTHTREFPPGTRLKAVKEWAIGAFHVPAHDATEHVLQVHGTADHPKSSEPLSVLVHGHECRVMFDLVPDVRVEG